MLTRGPQDSELLPRWRRTARICIAFAITITNLLLVLLCLSSTRAGGVSQAWIFLTGSCSTSSKYNLALHLLTNIISTGILASSSFFMQVLNAPMRADIDGCHARGGWLDIGVRSFHNLRVLPRFRAIGWGLLALTSVPIHLLANSAVFQTQRIETDSVRAIVPESQVYRDPGRTTTLAFSAGSKTCPTWETSSPATWDHSLYPAPPKHWQNETTSVASCDNNSFIPSPHISTTGGWKIPQVASGSSGGRWEEVGPRDCAAAFDRTCDVFRRYRAFLMVFQPPCSSTNVSSENAPAAVQQCFSTTCAAVACSPGSCRERCDSHFEMGGPSSDDWDKWSITLGRNPFCGAGDQTESPVTLIIKSCLAQRRESHCKLGISNQFLLVVCICTLGKVALCIFVTNRLGGEKLLFVLGDAMESFITQPDRYTAETSFLEVWEVDRWSDPYIAGSEQAVHCWQGKKRRLRVAVSLGTWMAFTALFGALVIFTVWLAATESIIPGTKEFDPFSLSHATVTRWLPLQTQGQFLPSVLFANSIQLLLALLYLFLTSICTRYVMAREWATFSSNYRPLRVSEPKGYQLSTYFLELPWSFVIPITVASISAHFLASNGIYVLVTEGGYLNAAALSLQGHHPDPALGISKDMFIGVGFSLSAIAVLIALVVLIMVTVLALAFRTLPGTMPVVGSNSVATSSCCRAASWQWVRIHGTWIRHRPVPGVSDAFSSNITAESPRVEEPRCLSSVKWGVGAEIKLPIPLQLSTEGELLVIQRLGFGVEGDGIESPLDGETYA